MRLNLGCGPKRYEGYVGVDLYDAGADVKCDIRKLPQEWEEKADEILCVHAFEHFPIYEARRMLLEWKRVLKPGGLLAIEVPDLKAACMGFLSDPDNERTGLFQMYGLQTTEHEGMIHKWGYTAQSLIRELERAGFRECRQAPVQRKQLAPLGIRVEAIR